ncbi:Leucine-rich repeat, typical subtype [Corchorus olitorius]|uniref:Leucine-rich repeat, typical subtype n=1 Tax=Corchorus olitorius TaxID=93759 RepID=A0A1R3K2L3_9ROSI|nr:Leucine-rich repeat, typical subtype [Corchorus olitorius]
MAKFKCFSLFTGKKKQIKLGDVSSKAVEQKKGVRTLQIKLQQPVQPLESDELKSTTFTVPVPDGFEEDSLCNVKVISHENPVGCEAAYEGEDEHEENASIKREFSDFDLQAHVANSGEEEFTFSTKRVASSDSFDTEVKEEFVYGTEKAAEKVVDMIQSGHISDPGIGRAEYWASPKLKRSCSNLETSNVLRRVADQLPPSKSQSFEQLQELSASLRDDFNPGSPASVMTRCSADRVMLKKHSSSQVLPSRSRRLWWKLFLWSHRNLHKHWTTKPQLLPVSATLNQQGGYSSDTVELHRAIKLSKMESPGSFTGESLNKDFTGNCEDNQSWKGFHNGVSGLWPQNQWVALPSPSSSFTRVKEWVLDLETEPCDDDVNYEEGIAFPPSPDTGKLPAKSTTHLTRHPDMNLSEEILHANNVIQSLNSSSTVAHISGIGLKAIPIISHLASLRSVNLSNNFIAHITAGSLPKGLHTLNLSRNKINTIEGLRELTRLRIVDLSYNRIARLGHGLSNCTLIKELYLAGNKISDVEGLHRLLKLTVLDLSFNKITTTKALGQLVANYNSLQALNLLGNPLQSNISDDQLRKAVCSLLPKLTYLNKQPIKPQRAREVLTDSVAKAALGSGSWSSRKKAVKRASQGGTTSSSVHRSSMASGQKSKNKLKSRTRHHSSLKSHALASSSR